MMRLQRRLDERLCLCIDAGRGLIEYQNLRIRRQHPRKRQQLTLTLGQVLAALDEQRVVPFRQSFDEAIAHSPPALQRWPARG